MGDSDRVQVLLELKHTLEDLIATRIDQMDQIKKEIENLNQQLVKISQQITSNSFTSADSLLENLQKKQVELKQPTPIENNFNSSSLSKRLFSNSNELWANFQYENETVFIRFLDPKSCGITPEKYINSFVRENLIHLKQSEPNLIPKITKKQEDGEEFVETITISNIKLYESFESIFNAIKKLII
jgi:hypothetical protein